MNETPDKTGGTSDEQLIELVRLFEGFNEASTSFAQSYQALERRIEQLSGQLELQSHLLQRTAGFLSSVLAHVPVGIIVIDLDGKITLFNEEAERLTGLRAEEVVDRSYGEVIPVDVNEPTSAIYTLNNGTVIDTRERELVIEDGNLPISFSTGWIYGDDGSPYGVLEVFEDLRPLRELQTRMQQNASLAALGEMAAQVAHELRNPLAGVQGFAQFLQEDLEPDHPSSKTAEKIIRGVKDIERIASRLLEFTRPMKPNRTQVDLVELIEQEVELAQAEVAQKDCVTVTAELPNERIKVTCDSSLIKQAILNLLKNSIQALEEQKGAVVTGLRWDLLRNRVRIFVRDDGVGIVEEDVPKIFNPFFTTRTQGTGLGLSMVRKIVETHGGTIGVDSSPGEGTTITMELPITGEA